MTKTTQQLQEESDRLARKTQRALARDDRELKKARNAGRIRRGGDSVKTKARLTDERLSQARHVQVIFSEIPKAPKRDWTDYKADRQAAFEDGESSYCNFGSGGKSITRHMSQATKIKNRATGGVTIIEHSDEHNDRYGTDKALHIDQDRKKYNIYWNIYDGYYKPSPFDRNKRVRVDNEEETLEPMWFWQAEERFIRETFGAAIAAQNDIYCKDRQYSRITDLDDPKSLKKWKSGHKPFQLLLQIGDREDSATPEQLMAVTVEFINEMKKKGNFVPIDFALHCDERGAPHVHINGYFIAIDENGHMIPSRTLALRQRGVMPSLGSRIKQQIEAKGIDPANYKEGRAYNNTVTFSAEMSEILFDIAEKHGVKVIREAQVLRGGKDQKKYLATLKGAPSRVAASLQRLEERRGNHFDVLNVLDTVRQGLQRFPTQWVDPLRAAAVAEETHKKLKAASNALDALPGLLEQAGIEGVNVEIKQLRETIARTHAAAGRARRNVGKTRAKDDDCNEIKLRERFFWLEQLDRLNAALARAGDARPDEELEELAEAKAQAEREKARADALEAELNAMRQQQSAHEEEHIMAGSMNERLRQIEAGIALSRVDDARRAFGRGQLVWDNGIQDDELLRRALFAECVRDGAANAELAQTTHLEIIALPGSWIRTGVDVLKAARDAQAPEPEPEPQQQESMSMRTEDWFASLNSSQPQQQQPTQQPSYRRPRPPL